ncbi:alpha/beta hydrolase [Solicola gregarius]|uniref:Alpha/beta hydrolase n=1 Tax=Solicola gregarius TaxID=2908642 RepID=A0AA46TIU3_9ACTN|nr:alpha/beta fold hydrolase [Solicola gregarius]UYM06055.1 alpha/beta hydrolase [Solicola gregarius]
MATGAGLRRSVRGALALLVVVGTVIALLTAFQRQLIYFPDSSPVPPAATVIEDARDIELHTADGLELGAWFAPAPTGVEGRGYAVLVAPGNGGNRLGRVELLRQLNAHGFAVLAMDYRGYGGNPGSPSEEGLALDANAAVDALEELGYPSQRTIYFGESLGTGVVAALQERRTPAGIVLRSPFTALADVGAHHYPWLPVRWLLRDRFPVVEHIASTRVPVTVIYGDRDSVVPSQQSAEVAESAPNLVESVVLHADHNDGAMFGSRVVAAVGRLARHASRGEVA